jgi:hypothetical protein
MEAMTTRAKSGSVSPVPVIEACTFNHELVSTWCNDASRSRGLKDLVRIVRATNNQGVAYTSHFISPNSQRELDTCKLIVGDLEVVEPNVSNFFGNGAITVVLPASEAVKVGSNRAIVMPWVIRLVNIV